MNNSRRILLVTAAAALFSATACSNMPSNNTYSEVQYVPVSNNCPNGCGVNTCCQVTPKNIAIAAKMRASNPQ